MYIGCLEQRPWVRVFEVHTRAYGSASSCVSVHECEGLCKHTNVCVWVLTSEHMSVCGCVVVSLSADVCEPVHTCAGVFGGSIQTRESSERVCVHSVEKWEYFHHVCVWIYMEGQEGRRVGEWVCVSVCVKQLLPASGYPRNLSQQGIEIFCHKF